MPYDWYHTAKLATPKSTHPLHIPDKASVYWVDYLLDETPHKMTDPEELLDYYERSFNKFQRTEMLAEPKPWPTCEADKETTENGIALSALKYIPSQRIRELANPVKKEKAKNQPVIRLPPIGEKYKLRTDNWFQDESQSTLDSGGVFRHPAYAEVRGQTPGRVFALDRGDFRSRSRPRRHRTRSKKRPETTTVPKLPPIDDYDPRHFRHTPPTPISPYSQSSGSGKYRTFLRLLPQQQQKGQGEGVPRLNTSSKPRRIWH